MAMYEFRSMRSGELFESLELIRSVFMEFEAPDYSQEGIQTFLEFTDYKNIKQGIDDGDLEFWVCGYGSGIVGVIAMKNTSHVCMLFVDKRFHRQGIALGLLNKALEGTDPDTYITVNSSPYGVPFYHAAGFHDTAGKKTTDGIVYVPMTAKCSNIMKAIKKAIG